MSFISLSREECLTRIISAQKSFFYFVIKELLYRYGWSKLMSGLRSVFDLACDVCVASVLRSMC